MWDQESGSANRPLRRESWEAVVVGVNYYTRRLSVNVTRTAGPRRVRVLSTINVGTVEEPGIKLGDRVLVVRNYFNEYVAIQHLSQ